MDHCHSQREQQVAPVEIRAIQHIIGSIFPKRKGTGANNPPIQGGPLERKSKEHRNNIQLSSAPDFPYPGLVQ